MPESSPPGPVQPIRRHTTVRRDVRHTFEVFVSEIGTWWPGRSHSLGLERVSAVRVERRRGGRVYEVWRDGTEMAWGEVLEWEPPARFVLSWEITPVATEVELRFVELGPELTRVELEHRGWERLDPDQLASSRPDYPDGWELVLRRFTAALG